MRCTLRLLVLTIVTLAARAVSAQATTAARPASLGLQANITFLYYRDIPRAQRFYEDVLGLALTVDQGYSKIYRVSATSYVGLVDQAQGLHRSSEQKPVTLSFVTADVDAWYAYLRGKGVEMVHELANGTRQPTRGFVARDPEGYYLEFETFRDDPQNAVVRAQLGANAPTPEQRDAMQWAERFLARYLGEADQTEEKPEGWSPYTEIERDLTPELAAALKADRDAAADNPGEIVGLDFDPFVDAQDFCGPYQARGAVPFEGRVDVALFNGCGWGHPFVPDVIYVLERREGRWVLANIRLRSGSTLLEVLAYYAEQRKQP
jgi:predicted enzyme related to lactoylglutathione lyase